MTKWLQCAALLAVTWLAGECAWTVRQVRPHLEVTLSNLDRTIIVTGAAATHLERASGTWESSAKAQSEKTTAAMSNVSAAAKQLTISVSRMESIVSSLLSTTQSAITQENVSLLETQTALRQSLTSTVKVSEEAQKVLVDADSQINNPAIKESVDSLAEAAQNTATFTREGAASMTDVHTALDYELKQLMAPVTKLKLAGNIALNVIRHLYF